MAVRLWLLVLLLSFGGLMNCSTTRPTSVATEVSDEEFDFIIKEEASSTLAETIQELSKLHEEAQNLRQNGDAAEAQERLEQALNIIAANELENPDLYEAHWSYSNLADAILDDYKSLMNIQLPPDDYSQHHEVLEFEWHEGQGHIRSTEERKPFITIPLIRNKRVEKWLQYFGSSRNGRKVYAQWLARGARYRPMIERILREMGLPEELYFLSMIESGFNPFARSKAKAVGPWQFIYGTGRAFGLKIDYYVDERRDPEKSTRAAARFLRNLYNEFQDWYLALSSYNCAKRRVYREIARHRTRDYWKLKNLPRETRNYVPKFIAAAIIGKSPQQFGFTDIDYLKPIEHEKVTVKGCIDLAVLTDCADADYTTMRLLNAELHHGFTPPFDEGYTIKIPRGSKSKFQPAYARLPESAKAKRAIHIVRKGETLSHIARRYRTSVRQLVALNRIKRPSRLSIGQRVFVPVTSASRSRTRSLTAIAKSQNLTSSSPSRNLAAVTESQKPKTSRVKPPPTRPINTSTSQYEVKKGDTIGHIAEAYGVLARDIRRWNNLRYGQYIYPGQILTVYKSTQKSTYSKEKPDKEVLAANFGPPPKKDNSKFYVVRRGDTLWRIARVFGVPLDLILKLNRLSKRSIIKPGDRLVISD